ncbi:hypothetical protein GBA52_008307 [Prunus armeniaca]|nr:hypothetical protein GBA52_008307 [Prunus armeniaca]
MERNSPFECNLRPTQVFYQRMVVRSIFFFFSKSQNSDLQRLHTKLFFGMDDDTQEGDVVLATPP